MAETSEGDLKSTSGARSSSFSFAVLKESIDPPESGYDLHQG